ncbi:MAG: hypothetical protein SGPRY_009366 [Prymnesium sp.]
MATARLQRQVDTILSSLDSALDSQPPAASPPPEPPDASPPLPQINSPVAPVSPFSISAGGSFLGAARAFAPAAPPIADLPSKAASFGARGNDAAAPVSLVALERLVNSTEEKGMGCRPFEHADYLARLATFRMAFFWLDKGEELSPPQCARHGWCLSGLETLHCSVCSSYIKTPSALGGLHAPGGGEDELRAQLVSQLSSSHRELCPWRGNSCPLSFTSILLPGRQGGVPSLPKGLVQTREALHTRARSLWQLQALPALAPSVSEQLVECARLCGMASDQELLAALARCVL